MPKVLLVAEALKGRYSEKTLKTFVESMKTLDRYCDIDNPVDVLRYIEEKVPRAKKNYWDFYRMHAKFYGIPLPSTRFRKNRPTRMFLPEKCLNIFMSLSLLFNCGKALWKIALPPRKSLIGPGSNLSFIFCRLFLLVVLRRLLLFLAFGVRRGFCSCLFLGGSDFCIPLTSLCQVFLRNLRL